MRQGSEVVPELEIEVRENTDRCTLRLIGELDMKSVTKLERALRWAEDGAAKSIVVDIDQVTFIDSTGLRMLMLANARALRGSGRVRFTRGAGQVAQLLAMTALDRVLAFVDERASTA